MENTFWGSKIKYSQLYRCFVRWFGTVCFIVKIPWSNREIARSLGHKWLPSKIPSIWDWLRPLPQNKFYRLFFFRIFVKGVKNITLIQILVAQMFSKILEENSGRFLRENIDPCVLGGNDIVKKISFSLKKALLHTPIIVIGVFTPVEVKNRLRQVCCGRPMLQVKKFIFLMYCHRKHPHTFDGTGKDHLQREGARIEIVPIIILKNNAAFIPEKSIKIDSSIWRLVGARR